MLSNHQEGGAQFCADILGAHVKVVHEPLDYVEMVVCTGRHERAVSEAPMKRQLEHPHEPLYDRQVPVSASAPERSGLIDVHQPEDEVLHQPGDDVGMPILARANEYMMIVFAYLSPSDIERLGKPSRDRHMSIDARTPQGIVLTTDRICGSEAKLSH
jgi:hypothetical protein